MSGEKRSNQTASVRQRLLNISKQKHEAFDLVLTRYALERFLYRLGKSLYSERFLLKGAMLFAIWGGEIHRPTRDIDFLGFGASDLPELKKVFTEICLQQVEPDGLEFLTEKMKIEEIREEQEYQGVRILFDAALGKAVIPLQVDIGFGDAVTPKAERINYPVVLDFPAPELLAYPIYTVVSEKFQAMVWLGIANSRMKDFYDIWIMLNKFHFDGTTLAKAIEATFARRGTPLPTHPPIALTKEFTEDGMKQNQWQAFIRRNGLSADSKLDHIVMALHDFLMPPTISLLGTSNFDAEWPPGGPWHHGIVNE